MIVWFLVRDSRPDVLLCGSSLRRDEVQFFIAGWVLWFYYLLFVESLLASACGAAVWLWLHLNTADSEMSQML